MVCVVRKNGKRKANYRVSRGAAEGTETFGQDEDGPGIVESKRDSSRKKRGMEKSASLRRLRSE